MNNQCRINTGKLNNGIWIIAAGLLNHTLPPMRKIDLFLRHHATPITGQPPLAGGTIAIIAQPRVTRIPLPTPAACNASDANPSNRSDIGDNHTDVCDPAPFNTNATPNNTAAMTANTVSLPVQSVKAQDPTPSAFATPPTLTRARGCRINNQ